MSEQEAHGLGNVGDRAKEVLSTMVGMASATTLGATSAAAYVTNAEVSDSYVVKAAEIAEQKSTSPEIRELAGRLRRDHTSTRASLRRDADRHQDTTPFSLDQRHKGLLEILDHTEPGDFDGVFLHQMTAAHTEALALQRGYANHGDDAQYRQLATVAVPVIESHLAVIKDFATSAVPTI